MSGNIFCVDFVPALCVSPHASSRRPRNYIGGSSANSGIDSLPPRVGVYGYSNTDKQTRVHCDETVL